MKKNVLLISMLLIIAISTFAQSTATDFTVADCSGNSHNLFSELNAGKVVVICWVMPCSSCISPARAAYDAVQSFASSNPGHVVFYLADDIANTQCSTLASWGNNNAMPNAIKFSNTAVNPADYGNVGMPKIVILGGWNHTVFYNEDDGNNTAGIQPAISQALSAANIEEDFSLASEFNLIPNTIQNYTKLIYTLKENSSINIDVINIIGKKIRTISLKNQTSGKHETIMDVQTLNDGIYFLSLNAGNKKQVIKFSVAH